MEELLSTTGRIFDIQRFSVHDGPGIRSIVFLKGCRLRCRWCCNPESQEYAVGTMNVNGKPKTVGRDVTVREVLETVKKDYPYYRRSGGGMTLSGGETFCQPRFAHALFASAKNACLDTAVESAGFAPFEDIAASLPYIDHFLMDIKHMSSEKHKSYTTQPNELILENARRIAREARELIIRVPVIPTFNDTPEEIGAIARFAASLPHVERIHLLPYHRLGQDKYGWLGREYTLTELRPPSDEHMLLLKQTAEAAGLHCQIGG